MRNVSKFFGSAIIAFALLTSCSGGGGGGGGRKDGGAKDGSTEEVDAGSQSDGSVLGDGSPENPALDGSTPPDPCELLSCNPGARCVVKSASASCVDQTCEQLACGATTRCEAHAQGGHICENNTCGGDVDCPSDRFCNAGLCKSDSCTAGARRCDGQKVFECADNGSADAMRFTCSMVSYFNSTCSSTASDTTCSCQDDWDCPAFTACENGLCRGTGAAPTCSLPAIPFSNTPPKVELFWGDSNPRGTAAHDGTAAMNPAPWADHVEVVNTPMVVNLDDDNGDGLVNELDFPEILFVSHKGDNAWANGIVRAIHGGGPKKGADYFARCGATLWNEGMPLPATACADADADADAGAPFAVGDIDNDGLPEIVYTSENNLFRILDHTGALLYTLTVPYALNGDGDSPSIANLDFTGYAEVILGRIVYMFDEKPGGGIRLLRILAGNAGMGSNQIATMACAADIIPSSPGLEIAAGATLYKLPATIPTCGAPPCSDVGLQVVWNATTVSGNTGLTGQGFCAVADIWGADKTMPPGPNNKPDGKPEVVLIDNGDLTILEGETGKIIIDRPLGGGDRGGAPNVDDFDGDGFMEVASALQDFYMVVDLQTSTGAAGSCPDWPAVIQRKSQTNGSHNTNPARAPGGTCTMDNQCDPAAVCNKTVGRCVCLHNGWKRDSDDDSSKATSSSVFDFNGDGAAEAIYNDECDFRVYEGTTGELLFSQESRSRTGIENPVVADVDNDGNAEVVTGMNTAVNDRCDDDPGGVPTGVPHGLRVWGDPTDTWVAARRIWNQQSYHVTNVSESGAILPHEPESWKSWSGRLYNTYRSQPRSYGVAPDLTVVGVGVSSPDAKCGSLSDNIDIAFEIENAGDLRVGPGVVVSFFGTWDGTEEALRNMGGQSLTATLTQSLEPGKSTILKVNFAKQYNGKSTLPASVRVVVDPASGSNPNGAERECHEDNNSKTATVDPGSVRADLTVEIMAVNVECPDAKVQTKVRNNGTAPAENVVVRYYAGDPAQGGVKLKDETLSAAIAPNGEATFTVTLESPSDRGGIKVFAVVDPDKKVEECDEANNRDSDNTEVLCNIGPQ